MKKITINITRLLILLLVLIGTLRPDPVSAAQSGIREQIESMQDAGMLSAYDAGLVRELGLTASLEPLQAGESVPELSMTIEWAARKVVGPWTFEIVPEQTLENPQEATTK